MTIQNDSGTSKCFNFHNSGENLYITKKASDKMKHPLSIGGYCILYLHCCYLLSVWRKSSHYWQCKLMIGNQIMQIKKQHEAPS